MILGIAGQNGRLLTELLLQKNYRVVGFGWKDSIENSETLSPFRDSPATVSPLRPFVAGCRPLRRPEYAESARSGRRETAVRKSCSHLTRIFAKSGSFSAKRRCRVTSSSSV